MKKLLLYLVIFFCVVQANAQNIGINSTGAAPNLSAMLDVDVSAFATKLGLLIPRVTSAQKTAMSPLPAVAQGLVVYQTDGVEGFYYNTSLTTTANWVYISPSGSSWAIAGNTLTGTLPTTPTEWIGSINAADWIIKTNNTERMRILSVGNVGINTAAASITDILNVTSTTGAKNAIVGTHTSAAVGSAYYAVGGTTSNAAYTPSSGFLGYHNGGNVTFGVYGASGDLAGLFNGKVGINTVPSAINGADLEIRNTTAGNPAVAMFRQTASQTTSGTVLNRIDFGDNHQTTAQAQISAVRGAAGGVGDLPTDIVFSNTPDASATLTERMRILYNGNVGIGTAAPDASALLDITSSSKGMLIPRVALTASNVAAPVASPLTSLMVYNTAIAGSIPNTVVPGYYYWSGTEWVSLNGGQSSNDWSTTGNAGTSSASNFIGTTDAQSLQIKVNNQKGGYMDQSAITATTALGYQALNTTTGANNSAYGYQALTSNTSGTNNTAVGYQSIYTNTAGNWNTAIGYKSLWFNTGSENTAIGYNTLLQNTGTGNTGVGLGALSSNQAGNYNVAVGYHALDGNTPNTTQVNNVALGSYSGYNNQTGINNIFVGTKSGYNNLYGSHNVFLGNMAGFNNLGTSGANLNGFGNNNVFLGDSAGYSNNQGQLNVFFGNSAGFRNTVGYYNTFIGNLAGYGNTMAYNNTFIGTEAGKWFGTNPNDRDNIFIGDICAKYKTGGIENTFLGTGAGLFQIDGDKNTFIGDVAGVHTAHGSFNTFLGFQAGGLAAVIQSGLNNTFVGANADAIGGDWSNSTAIGAYSAVGASNAIVLGGTGAYAVNVGIGLTTPLYALHVTDVINVGGNQVGYFKNTNTTSVDGVGVKGETSNTPNNYGLGVHGIGNYIGVYGVGHTSGLAGVYGSANGATYGVYCVGNGGYTGSWSSVSDKRFKENVQPLTGALNKVLKLEPKTYTFKKDEQYKRMNFPETLQIGLIAQEVETIFPELVNEGISPKGDNDEQFTFKSMNYIGLTPILVQAIKEQQKIIDSQNFKLESQSQSIEQLTEQMKNIQALLITNGLKTKPDTNTNVSPNNK